MFRFDMWVKAILMSYYSSSWGNSGLLPALEDSGEMLKIISPLASASVLRHPEYFWDAICLQSRGFPPSHIWLILAFQFSAKHLHVCGSLG
ncbi:hypothetical protein CDAR_172041 [Caerostris darwini]|uniref:Uncharacterized protein n=1 Tax=Caerostris darwini TaxID=1538125 RepID=A0AAV4U9E7_9ARAC|nr:hypothetical protein CDAR_172041 [Caerostris darwini]